MVLSYAVLIQLFMYLKDFLICEVFKRSCRPFEWELDRLLFYLVGFFRV
ncbi:MAG: hypothetical protein ACLFQX_12150 [Candidatus Kapaibacterium sp.]